MRFVLFLPFSVLARGTTVESSHSIPSFVNTIGWVGVARWDVAGGPKFGGFCNGIYWHHLPWYCVNRLSTQWEHHMLLNPVKNEVRSDRKDYQLGIASPRSFRWNSRTLLSTDLTLPIWPVSFLTSRLLLFQSSYRRGFPLPKSVQDGLTIANW